MFKQTQNTHMRMPRKHRTVVDIFRYTRKPCHCSRYYWPGYHRGNPGSIQASTCGICDGQKWQWVELLQFYRVPSCQVPRLIHTHIYYQHHTTPTTDSVVKQQTGVPPYPLVQYPRPETKLKIKEINGS
jgi:hypothetical protein